MAKKLKLFRGWLCYWLMQPLRVFPGSWHFHWPLSQIEEYLFQYAAFWAFWSNPQTKDLIEAEEIKRS